MKEKFTIIIREDGSGEMDGWPFKAIAESAVRALNEFSTLNGGWKPGAYNFLASEDDAESFMVTASGDLVYK